MRAIGKWGYGMREERECCEQTEGWKRLGCGWDERGRRRGKGRKGRKGCERWGGGKMKMVDIFRWGVTGEAD